MTTTLTYKTSGPGLRVDLDALMAGGLLLQAASGGGKSRAIRQLLEETHGRVQHLVLDPEGEFASLREHFDYVLAAPSGGDVVATPKTAKLLCRRLVEIGASAVIDIYDLKLPDKREFVRLFLEDLMALPRAMWKPIIIVIDESDLFAPQTSDASSTSAIIDTKGRGRKRGFQMVLTTRRLSRLHKDVADVANRMIGRTGLDVDVKRAGDELGFEREKRATLPLLSPGEFYVYGPAMSPVPQLVRTGEIRTTHPKAGRVGAVAPPAPAKVRALVAQLADLPKEAEQEARTLADTQRENAQLKAELSRAQRAQPAPIVDPRAIERAVAAAVKPYQVAANNVQRHIERVGEALEQLAPLVRADLAQLNSAPVLAQTPAAVVSSQHTEAVRYLRPTVERHEKVSRFADRDGNYDVNASEQKILDAIAFMSSIGSPLKKQNVAFFSGYTVAGRFNNLLGGLRSKGLIEYPEPNAVALTSRGDAVARKEGADIRSLDDLHDLWIKKLDASQGKILRTLLTAGAAMPKAQLASETGYEVAGRFNNLLGSLRSLGAVDYPQPGYVRAGAALNPEGLL